MSRITTLLPGFAAVVALAVTTACGPNAENTAEETYCDVAKRADSKIGAELADFDPAISTPADLERILTVAVEETTATSDAAPDQIADELQLLKERWRTQQQIFADADYVFADAPPEVMELVGEEREAFEAVNDYNHEQCGMGEDHDDHTHDSESAG